MKFININHHFTFIPTPTYQWALLFCNPERNIQRG